MLNSIQNPTKASFKIGFTFSGFPFWIGLFLIIAGVFVGFGESVLNYTFGVISVIIGLLIIPSFQTLAIDGKTKKAIRYLVLAGFKISLEETELKWFNELYLSLYSDNQTMNMTSISTTVRTRSYEVYGAVKDAGVLLFESTDYKKSLEFMETSATVLGIPCEDRYKKWRENTKRKYQRQ